MNYLELYKRAVALGWIPTKVLTSDEDCAGNYFRDVHWVFRSRLGRQITRYTLEESFESLDQLLEYYSRHIDEAFALVFTAQPDAKLCPRCESANCRATNTRRYVCAFCGMKYGGSA